MKKAASRTKKRGKRRNKKMNMQKAMLSVSLFIFRLAILILVITGIFKVGQLSYFYCYSIVSNVAVDEEPGRDVSLTLTREMSSKDLARLLERKGLIEDGDIFLIQLKINKYEDRLIPGDYMLNTSMTPKDMMKVMSGTAEEEEEE